MDFSKINIESVLIGSLMALFFKSFLDRILVAIKLNRLRNVILDYSTYIGLDKSLQYMEDMKYIRASMKAETEEEINALDNNYSVDAMPMFTSDVFNSFSQDELRRIAYNTTNYITILDIAYSIDFLKEYMPLQLWEKYQIKVREHMEDEKIKIEDEIKHFQECGYLKSLAEKGINEIDMKASRAYQTHSQFHKLINSLSGFGIVWIIKYFFKQ